MTIFIALIAILQSFSISLGVGSSTLAITNFFVAIADGQIQPDERRMMGVVYVVLRIAMVVILITTLILLSYQYAATGLSGMSAFSLGQLLAIIVLFINAILMTARIMPSNFGPSIQAGSWYTLGMLSALVPLGLIGFSFLHFLFAYITWVVLAIAIVNGIMAIQMGRRRGIVK